MAISCLSRPAIPSSNSGCSRASVSDRWLALHPSFSCLPSATCLPPKFQIGHTRRLSGRALSSSLAFRHLALPCPLGNVEVGHRQSRLVQVSNSKRASAALRKLTKEKMTPDEKGKDSADPPPVSPGYLENSEQAMFLESLMPKEEIGAKKFLKDHSQYDGRDVVIAIFDSGVDPGAEGLQTTTDHKPKIIDVLDCTGSGDVDTSTVTTADSEGFLTGLSGVKLRVNPTWKNPSGKWRVGSKRAFQLFTADLVSRLTEERTKRFDSENRHLGTEALRQLAAFDLKHGRAPEERERKKEREELQARVDLLAKMMDEYEDPGPVIDAVVWHDGDTWRAALDTRDLEGDLASARGATSAGALADFEPMTNFRLERQYGTFSRRDACHFCLNIFDEGNVLSIVTDSSPHGTHVAGIAAAHHPNEPALNGIAPGARLVSCKVGDSRLAAMETCSALSRALIAAVDHNCDLINMSYGEPSSVPNYGRFVDLSREVVDKHGIMFISSAGNAGPALSTVGAPGGNTSAIMGIGAYLSPAMATAAHSMLEAPAEGLQYTWSSRGPTADGDMGVNLSAPGGAIAPVPKWTLQRRQLMNGTSMASPCACGGIALLLSGLKANAFERAPHVVRLALENTALPLGSTPEEPLSTGRGLLQVHKAYEYMLKERQPDMWYDISIANAAGIGSSMRGIYLREPQESCRSSEWRVTVKPLFHEEGDNLHLRVPFELKLQLAATAGWLRCPKQLLLAHGGRSFNVRVDAAHLEEGLHFAEVCGYDMQGGWKGPLFRIPVTVVKPQSLAPGAFPVVKFADMSFAPGHIERHFLAVPEGATWLEAALTVRQLDTPRTLLVHALQLLPKRKYTHRELKSYVTFGGPGTRHLAVACQAGGTMELTVAQFWSSGSGAAGPILADLEVKFHGLQSPAEEICLDGGVGVRRVETRSTLGVERLAPSATLNRVRTTYRPTDAKIEPLSPARDMLPGGRQIHSLLLTYKFCASESGKYTPRMPLLNDRVYDNQVEAQFHMLFDANKKLLLSGDIYPKGVKLAKGDYIIRFQIRHDDVAHLERLKNSPLVIDRTLEEKNSVKLSIYNEIDDVITGKAPFKACHVAPGERRPFFLAGPADDKLPKDAVPGTLLLGRLYLEKFAFGMGTDGGQACPHWSQITYVVPPAPKAEEKAKVQGSEATKPLSKHLLDELRDAKVKVLCGLATSSDAEISELTELAATLKEEYPCHLALLTGILRQLDSVKDPARRTALLPKIIEAADDVAGSVDCDALARHLAQKSESEAPDAQKTKKEMERLRDALVDALHRKGLALAALDSTPPASASSTGSANGVATDGIKGVLPAWEGVEEPVPDGSAVAVADVAASNDLAAKPEKAEASEKALDAFEENFAELRKWVDVTQSKYALLAVKRERRAGRPACALKVLNKAVEDAAVDDKVLLELRIELLKELGFDQWAALRSKWNNVAFPPSYPLF